MNLTLTERCPLCSASYRLFGFRSFVYPTFHTKDSAETIPIAYVQCTECGLIFQQQMMADPNFYYSSHQYRINVQKGESGIDFKNIEMEEKRAILLEPVLKDLDEDILYDIGCSSGALLDIARNLDYTAHGAEYDPSYRRLSKADAGIDTITIRDALVTLIHVLEHISNPREFLQGLDAQSLLIEVPSAYHPGAMQLHHPVLYTQHSLLSMLRTSGWDVQWIKTWPDVTFEGEPNILAYCTRRVSD